MRRLTIAAILLASPSAHATEFWQQDVDGSGFQCVNVSRLGVGVSTVNPLASAEFYMPNNGDNDVMVANDDPGSFASAGFRAALEPTGVPPLDSAAVGILGLGISPPTFGLQPGSMLVEHAATAGDLCFSDYNGDHMTWVFGPRRELSTLAMYLDKTAGLTLLSLAGAGTRCLQTDASGNVQATSGACGSGAGTISALTHDVLASGSGSVSAEVVGITDGTSVDHPVGASAWVNGQGVVLDGSGHLVTAPFQAPLVACTDYVSVTCQAGATDIGGTNATTTVIAIEDAATARGYVTLKSRAAPGPPSAGDVRLFSLNSIGEAVSIDASSVARYMVADRTCSTSQWINRSLAGALNCTRPTTTDVLGPTGGGTQCLQTDNAGNITATGASCGSGSGTVTSVTGSGGVACSPSSPNPNCTLANLTCGSNTWVSSATTGGGLACTQPAFSNLSGSLSCAQTPAFSGDLSSAGGTCSVNVVGIETGGAVRGTLNAAVASAPSTPGTGISCWTDNTGDNWSCKNTLGQTTVMPRATTCAGSNWVSAIGSTSAVTCSQPAFSDLSGSVACGQMPALTGDVTSSAGSCATTVPTKGKVLVSATDPAIDYLDTKIESTSGNIVVSHISGPPEFVNLNADATKLFTVSLAYSFQIFTILNDGEAVAGGTSPNPIGPIGTVITEYPMGVAAGTVKLSCYMITNHITSGTFTIKAAVNGVDTSAALSFNSASTTGVTASSTTIGSPSTADTWGLDFTSVGTANNCGSGLCPNDMTCTILLQP